MFFIDFSDIKIGTFLNYVFYNVLNEIGIKSLNKIVDDEFKTKGVITYIIKL